jgi:hypothetical protein
MASWYCKEFAILKTAFAYAYSIRPLLQELPNVPEAIHPLEEFIRVLAQYQDMLEAHLPR